jgi:hypothetical protein
MGARVGKIEKVISRPAALSVDTRITVSSSGLTS